MQEISPLPVQIEWHQNRTTYLTIRKMKGILHFRLHKLFQNSSAEIGEALIQMALKKDRKARALVRKEAAHYFSKVTLKPKPLPTAGQVYDLKVILKRVIEAYFPEAQEPSIGWVKGREKRFRSITFGTYDRHQNLIRINQHLDHSDVPPYFVEFIVYHEMLHALIPAKISKEGRCLSHTPEFRRKEREFLQFEEAKKWEKGSLHYFQKKNSSSRSMPSFERFRILNTLFEKLLAFF